MTPRAFLRVPLALAAAAALAACVQRVPVQGGWGGAQAPPAAVSRNEAQIVAAELNRNRGGCPPLAWDDAAARAAQAHSDDMARRRYFAHESPEGRRVADRLAAQGAAYRAVAENISMGYARGEEVVRGWMNSPGHRQNIQWCSVTRMGVGVSGTYWTLVLYAPAV